MDVEDIQTIFRQMPGVSEDIKWGHDLVFSIGGKMFCVVGLDQTQTTAAGQVLNLLLMLLNLSGFGSTILIKGKRMSGGNIFNSLTT